MNNRGLLLKLIEIFQLFTEFNDKNIQDKYNGLNINEVHTIDYIGNSSDPNVTRITQQLKITKGAVTKITKRLIRQGYLDTYQSEDNKKEKYFILTNSGRSIFDQHKNSHNDNIERDAKIFDHFTEKEKIVINRFLDVLKNDFEKKLY